MTAPADLHSASATVARPSDRRVLAAGRRWLMVFAATTALWLLPSLLDTRSIAQLSRFVLFGVAALGLDLLWGRAGLLSFGHAALFGLGCYASGVVLTRTTWAGNDAVAVLAGVAVPAAFGFVAGLVLFKGIRACTRNRHPVVRTSLRELAERGWHPLVAQLAGRARRPHVRTAELRHRAIVPLVLIVVLATSLRGFSASSVGLRSRRRA